MKPKNFPGRKYIRQMGAVYRAEKRRPTFEEEDKYERLCDVRTKKYRGGDKK